MDARQTVPVPGGGFVFISYRRDDAAAQAGRIADLLTARFGQDSVYLDVDSIEPGVDFVDSIHRAVVAADLFVVMIGAHWLTLTDKEGNRRIDLADDYVRLELELALQRDIPVVPVLVNDAQMPAARLLPPTVRSLARRNATRVRDASFRADVGPLLEMVESARPLSAGGLPAAAWSASVVENRVGMLAWNRAWSVRLTLDDDEHDVRLRSSWWGWHFTIGNVEFWRGRRVKDVTDCRFPLRDGTRTRYLTISGSFGMFGGRVELRIDGHTVLSFDWNDQNDQAMGDGEIRSGGPSGS